MDNLYIEQILLIEPGEMLETGMSKLLLMKLMDAHTNNTIALPIF